MRWTTIAGVVLLAGATAFVVLVPHWQLPAPRGATELGLPSSIQFAPSAAAYSVNHAPVPLPPAQTGGPMATAQYKNVKVLTDVSAAEFMRLQHAITNWVSPVEGCSFCHVKGDYASDANPRKEAARVMLQMTRHLNTDWKDHVKPSGVTCFTCHRGQPVPPQIWLPEPAPERRPMIAKQENWHETADTVRKFFPDDSYSEYLLQDEPISMQSTAPLPNGTVSEQIVAKRIYEMMMTMSDGIGVNCGFCHNSRAFASWDQSTPYRWVAYHAIRLVRDLNRNFLPKVAKAVPQTRLLVGENPIPALPPRARLPRTGNGFVLCATCHYGLPKPLNGANMLKDYPGLGGPAQTAAAISNHTE